MKKLDTYAINQLLSILPPHPALCIMQFTDRANEISDAIQALAVKQGHEFMLNITEPEYLEEAKSLSLPKICTVKPIKWEQRRYASMGTLYYNVFVTTPVPDDKKELFLENVLHHIKTAGHIVFFLPKDDRALLDRWWAMLEEKTLVSICTLDITEEYNILVGKKMHGWDSSFK